MKRDTVVSAFLAAASKVILQLCSCRPLSMHRHIALLNGVQTSLVTALACCRLKSPKSWMMKSPLRSRYVPSCCGAQPGVHTCAAACAFARTDRHLQGWLSLLYCRRSTLSRRTASSMCCKYPRGSTCFRQLPAECWEGRSSRWPSTTASRASTSSAATSTDKSCWIWGALPQIDLSCSAVPPYNPRTAIHSLKSLVQLASQSLVCSLWP